MQANDLRAGRSIKHEGELYIVLEASHRSPGNKRAFMQISMRNLKNGKIIQQKFSSTEEIESADLDARKVQYLYKDDTGYHFMDQEDYETHTVGEDIVGENKYYLKENDEAKLYFYEKRAVDIELPPKVVLEVIESPEWVKGDSVSNNLKPAVLETGKKVMVPIFIKQGSRIVVDTRTGEYISRE